MAEPIDSSIRGKLIKEGARKQAAKRTPVLKSSQGQQNSKPGKINVLPQINHHVQKGNASAAGKAPAIQSHYESLYDSQDRSIRKAKSGVSIVKSKKRPPLPKQSKQNPNRYLESSGKQRSGNTTATG